MEENESLMRNKAVVLHFNKNIIEKGDEQAFREPMAPDFVNRTAPPDTSAGPDGMLFTLNRVLRPLKDITVEIQDQVAEGDRITTRKTIHGTHRGELLGIPPTNRRVDIEVIDIVRVKDGRYAEHWGVNTLPSVRAQLRQAADGQ